LIDEAFAAGRPVARRRAPEVFVGGAELGADVAVGPAGPGSEVLPAKRHLLDRGEPERHRRFEGQARRTAEHEPVGGNWARKLSKAATLIAAVAPNAVQIVAGLPLWLKRVTP
jgi:hypothetical protein